MKLGTRVWALFCMVLMLGACAMPSSHVEVADLATSPWALASSATGGPSAPWQHHEFPGKRASHYRYARLDGRDAVMVQARSSASMLRHSVRIEPAQLSHLRFSWKVPALISAADLSARHHGQQSIGVILDIEPVAHILALAIDRDRCPGTYRAGDRGRPVAIFGQGCHAVGTGACAYR